MKCPWCDFQPEKVAVDLPESPEQVRALGASEVDKAFLPHLAEHAKEMTQWDHCDSCTGVYPGHRPCYDVACLCYCSWSLSG